MNILDTLKEMDPATLKNIGVIATLAIGALIVGAGAIVAAFSIAKKAIKAVAKGLKGLACCAIFLGIGYVVMTNTPIVEEVEEVEVHMIEGVK